MLSARRVPEVLAAPVADRRLTTRLTDVIGRAPDSSCLTVAVNGRPVFSHDPALPLIPASIEKLLTGEAARGLLGTDAVLTTTVASDVPIENGTLAGNLFVVGGGDPLLMTDDYAQRFRRQPVVHSRLEGLADAVAASGLTHVTGGVIGDESRYDKERYLPEWPARFAASAEIGPLGALLVNDGLVAYPPSPDVRTPAPTPADDPAVHAADVLTQLLRARGITIDVEASSGQTPDGAAAIATLDSQPIGEIVKAMVSESDNGSAELLTKEMGVHDSGIGSTEAGVAAMNEFLRAESIPLDGTVQFDGSGLATENRVTCGAVQTLLDAEGPDSPLAASMPVAGRTGTLAERFVDSPLTGRLRAKTGTLNQANALAGYLDSIQGTRLSFSFLMNVDAPALVTADDVALQEEVATILLQYPESVDVAQLGPR